MVAVMEVVKDAALVGLVPALRLEHEHGWPALVLSLWLLLVVGVAVMAQQSVRVAPRPVTPDAPGDAGTMNATQGSSDAWPGLTPGMGKVVVVCAAAGAASVWVLACRSRPRE